MVPDPETLSQGLQAVVLSGATTVVTAMATDTWHTARRGFVRLFSRGGHQPEIIQAHLDRDAAVLSEEQDPSAARQVLISSWQRMLADLLREDPRLREDLEALITEISKTLPAGTGHTTQYISPRDNAMAFVVGNGKQENKLMPSSSRPAPAGNDDGDGE
ncbi:hypothetical protein ABZW02_26360 [Streptomyces sp. NPDC005180]|uniref:hypothetical protein n=1 Tax=Streptomyces sp. NPDC005180 TaxID=3156868 RepID=UPI0033ABB4BB